MCQILKVTIYCEHQSHGYIPLSKDESELNRQEEDAVKGAFVMSRDTSTRCGVRECLRTRNGWKTAKNPENRIYLRFREGLCWSCICDKARNKLRYMGVSITSENIRWEGGEMWHSQIRYLQRQYGLPRIFIPAHDNNPADSEADLGRILSTLSERDVGLSEVFTSSDYCITNHVTGEERHFRRPGWWLHRTPHLHR